MESELESEAATRGNGCFGSSEYWSEFSRDYVDCEQMFCKKIATTRLSIFLQSI